MSGLGDALKAARTSRPGKRRAVLSQREVADDLDIAERTIGSWERGEVIPEWKNLVALIEYYELELAPLSLLWLAALTQREPAEMAAAFAAALDEEPFATPSPATNEAAQVARLSPIDERGPSSEQTSPQTTPRPASARRGGRRKS